MIRFLFLFYFRTRVGGVGVGGGWLFAIGGENGKGIFSSLDLIKKSERGGQRKQNFDSHQATGTALLAPPSEECCCLEAPGRNSAKSAGGVVVVLEEGRTR